MSRFVTSKVTKILLNIALTITLGVMLSLMLSFGSRAEQTLHTSSDTEIPSGWDIQIDQDTTIVIDENKTIGDIIINGSYTLIIQGNETDELKANRIGYANSNDAPNLIVESGRVNIVNATRDAIFLPKGTVTIKGGYLSADSQASLGLHATNINISGGEVKVKGKSSGIVSLNDINISGGKVYGEVYGDRNVVGRGGIFSPCDLIISGGEVTAKASYDGTSDYYRERTASIICRGEAVLTGGMKIIQPAGKEFVITNIGFDCYSVKDDTGNKMITVVIKKGEANNSSQNTVSSKNNSTVNNHTHSFSWVVTKSPTSTSDGEEAYMCSCGEIERTSILPAISAFEEETINKIKNAPANAVIEVETSLFNSFGVGVRDALTARTDVTLKVSFLEGGYKGQRLKVTIPTGIDRYALWDENGWLGLCRAGSTLGYDKD